MLTAANCVIKNIFKARIKNKKFKDWERLLHLQHAKHNKDSGNTKQKKISFQTVIQLDVRLV